LKILFSALIFFALVFRPGIYAPSLSLSLPIFVLVFLYFVLKPWNLIGFLAKIGWFKIYLVLFILLVSLIYDLSTGALGLMGGRSQFFTTLRFIVYAAAAYWFINVLIVSYDDFVKVGSVAVIFQILLALGMFMIPDMKIFFYKVLSGYDGSEKIFREYFFDVRIFGWSEELFYTAPVFVLLFSLMIAIKSGFAFYIYRLFSFLFALVNARISIVVFILYLSRIKFLMLFSIMMFVGVLSFILFYDVITSQSTVAAYILDDLSSGESRTLQILFGHIIFPSNVSSWLFGSGVYLYGGVGQVYSDIGHVIILNYGGLFYFLSWLLLFFLILKDSFSSLWFSFLIFSIFMLLGVKGLIFSGNAMTFYMFCMFFLVKKFGYFQISFQNDK